MKEQIDTSISVPYQTLVDVFSFIYGKGVITNVCSGLIQFGMAETRGIRNNNPFNIKRSSSHWLGKVPFKDSTDKTFEQFVDLDYGLRAGIILLRNYVDHGYNTYRKILNRYAPSSENDVDSYLAFLICSPDYDPDFVFEYRSEYFFNLVMGICYYESNYKFTIDKVMTILHKFNL